MQFYIQMRWNIEGRLSLDEVFDLQVKEAQAVKGGTVTMYKVAGQRRVLAIAEFDTADELDRAYMSKLPLREYLEVEALWPVRPFERFLEDCQTGFTDDTTALPHSIGDVGTNS